MGKNKDNPICRRVAAVRRKTCGPRGKARFAKQLGISPSTYDYYESARVPPAELLVKITDVGGVDLRWLLTGETSAGPAVAANHPAVRRAAELIGDHPQAAEPLLAFLDVLAGTMTFPKKPAKEASERKAGETSQPVTPISPEPAPTPAQPYSSKMSKTSKTSPASPAAAPDAPDARRSWIPILGRSAAGVPRFWSEAEDATGLTTLGDLIARCTESPAAEAVEPGRALADDGGMGKIAAPQPVQIITLREPVAWGQAGQGGEVVQFIASAAIKAEYPAAFAVRIDGDSMSPEIYHGDLVVLSATAPAVAGMPAVVQIENAVGVTCKMYHPLEMCLKLTPINETGPTITVAHFQVEWALRVLARIHPSAGN